MAMYSGFTLQICDFPLQTVSLTVVGRELGEAPLEDVGQRVEELHRPPSLIFFDYFNRVRVLPCLFKLRWNQY